MQLADIRKEYTLQNLDPSIVAADPLAQFTQWFAEALQGSVLEPNAMHLSTVSANGRPSGRIVLLKGIDEQGFLFFTNYNSRKGLELAQKPYASLTFFWPELERQIRIEGIVEKVSKEESDTYFHSRPQNSQIGAWVSPQSQVISNRNVLEEKNRELNDLYKDQLVPRPTHWGGYRVIPDSIEFWQGRPSRLHDRVMYEKVENASWKIERLAP